MHMRVPLRSRPRTTFPSPSFLCRVIDPPCQVVITPPPSHCVVIVWCTSHPPYEQLLVAEGSGAMGVTVCVVAGPGLASSSFTKKKEKTKQITYLWPRRRQLSPGPCVPAPLLLLIGVIVPHPPCGSTHNQPCKQWLADEGQVLVMLVLPCQQWRHLDRGG